MSQTNDLFDSTVELEWPKTKKSYSQVHAKGLEYAFVNADLQVLHTPFTCKDYLQDTVMSQHHQIPVTIYGFSHTPGKNPILDLDRTRLLLVNAEDEKFLEKIPSMLEFVNQIEKKLKLKRTKASLVGNPPKKYNNGAVYLLGSNRWLLSPPLISLYSLLLRVGFLHKSGDDYQKTIDRLVSGTIKGLQHNDRDMMTTGKKALEWLFSNGYAKMFYKDAKRNYSTKSGDPIEVSTMHNYMGIVNFANMKCQSDFPYWYKHTGKKN